MAGCGKRRRTKKPKKPKPSCGASSNSPQDRSSNKPGEKRENTTEADARQVKVARKDAKKATAGDKKVEKQSDKKDEKIDKKEEKEEKADKKEEKKDDQSKDEKGQKSNDSNRTEEDKKQSENEKAANQSEEEYRHGGLSHKCGRNCEGVENQMNASNSEEILSPRSKVLDLKNFFDRII